ncbi:hypothetical protein ACTAQJ_10695 [Arthrobacter sp. alpha11c]
MSEALFNFEASDEPAETTAPVERQIHDYQLAAIREAFDDAGIDGQDRRQEIVQSCVWRPVSALRQLKAAEAHRVLNRIKQIASAQPRPEGASSWDLREEDTWIDKL